MTMIIDEIYDTEGLIYALEFKDTLYIKTTEGWFIATEEPAEIYVKKFEDIDVEEVYIFGKYKLLAKVVDKDFINQLEEAYQNELMSQYEQAKEWFEF